mgnify:CR=1 FL=1
MFTSAVQRSGLQDLATGERHVLLVMVEAMGQPVDPALRSRLVNLWATPEVRARYLLKVAALMRKRKAELTALMVLEVGKSWVEADADVAVPSCDAVPCNLSHHPRSGLDEEAKALEEIGAGA